MYVYMEPELSDINSLITLIDSENNNQKFINL